MHWLFAPFWNRQERRLRAGWRLLIYFILYGVVQMAPSALLPRNLLAQLVGQDLSASFINQGLDLERIGYWLLILLGVLLVTWLTTRLIDRRPFAQLGFQLSRRWWQEFVLGLAVGALLMVLIFSVEWLAGWVRIKTFFQVATAGSSFALAFVTPLVVFIVVGIQEELLSRGYQIRNVAEGIAFPRLGTRNALIIAWLLTSALFGLLHFLNPNATLTSTFNIALAGIFLGIGYILTERLAIPIGLHITWNLFQGNVFGFPVSGNDFSQVTVIAIEQGGPPLWTGGRFGPEAGLLGIIAVTLGTLFIWWWVRRQDGVARLQDEIAVYQPYQQGDRVV